MILDTTGPEVLVGSIVSKGDESLHVTDVAEGGTWSLDATERGHKRSITASSFPPCRAPVHPAYLLATFRYHSAFILMLTLQPSVLRYDVLTATEIPLITSSTLFADDQAAIH